MARGRKKENLTPEERLQAALVPESEQPYKIPKNWCWVRLTSLKNGDNGFFDGDWILSENMDPTGNIRLLQLSDIGIGEFLDKSNKHINEKSFKELECSELNEGDIMISRMAEPIARSCIVPKFPYKIITAVDVAVLRCNSHLVINQYLNYICNTKWFTDLAFSLARGTTRVRITRKNLGEMPIPLSPLPEQQRIVDRIESLFAKLDEAKQKAQDALDSFETRKAAILHKAFTGELTAQWRKEHGVGMESWETHELVECFEIVSGIQKTPARSPRHNPIPYLAVANVYRNKIDLSDIRYFEVTPEEIEKLKLQDKDILIVEGNGSGKEIGRCAMWHNELPLCVHQNHIIRIRNKSPKILPEYVLYYLNSETGKSVMQERAKTTAGLFNLSAGKVKTIPLPFASLDEQAEIVHILDNLIAKEQQAKEAAEKVLEQIDLIKKSILARAFRGELGTNDPSEESAVELLRQVLSTSDR